MIFFSFFLIVISYANCFDLLERINKQTLIGKNTIQDLNDFNNRIRPLLSDLEKRKFFRIFKTDLESQCQYWVVQKLCGKEGGCTVCECDKNDIPLEWAPKTSVMNPVHTFMSEMDSKITWDEQNCDAWTPTPCEEDLTYVDLIKNPHSNTGYGGPLAGEIWRSIYEENCFKGGKVQEMCYEEKIFYGAISAIHQLTTLAIARYNKNVREKEYRKRGFLVYEDFEPNMELFERAILPYNDRIENLFFMFSFIYESMKLVDQKLIEYDYSTGNELDDAKSKELVKDIVGSLQNFNPKSCECAKEFKRLKVIEDDIRKYFYNISLISDCIECEKCKMWTKLDILGFSVAFKLFLSDSEEGGLDIQFDKLHRNEIIALFNLFGQLSRAIENYNFLYEIYWRKTFSPYISFAYFGLMILIVLLGILSIFCLRKRKKSGEKKEKNKKRKKEKKRKSKKL